MVSAEHKYIHKQTGVYTIFLIHLCTHHSMESLKGLIWTVAAWSVKMKGRPTSQTWIAFAVSISKKVQNMYGRFF